MQPPPTAATAVEGQGEELGFLAPHKAIEAISGPQPLVTPSAGRHLCSCRSAGPHDMAAGGGQRLRRRTTGDAAV